MRRLHGAIALVLATTPGLGGCAWLLGHGDLPQPRSPVRPQDPRVSVTEGALAAQCEFLGLGERLVTATNAFGRLSRVVNPYGEDTFVFQVRIENRGQGAIVVLPAGARLDVGAESPLEPRTLDAYRTRWPSWAVTNEREGEDQGRAYTHVLQTLLLERQVPAGESTEGRLAFPVAPVRDTFKLTLPYRQAQASRTLTFRWAL